MMGASMPSTPAAANAVQCEGEAQPDGDIDVDRSPAPAAEAHAGAQAPQIVGHEREVGRGHGDIGALRAHGDPDRARAQCERIVDAVADHHGTEAQFDLLHHMIHFLFRQHLGVHRRYADLRGNLMRHRGSIAGQQHDALDTELFEIADRGACARAQLIVKQQPAQN